MVPLSVVEVHNELHLPSPKPGDTTGGSGRVEAGRRMAGPEGTSTFRFAQETCVSRAHHGIEGSCPERLFGSTNSLIRTFRVPGHPWDEKGLQRQKCIDLLVGIQERRAFSSR